VWLRQVHGRRVVVVVDGDDPSVLAGAEADAVVTTRDDVALAVHGADCAVVGLWSPEGVIGAVHAGWRGLELDVVGAAATAMRSLGATALSAVAGPCIGAECYEFGADDLDRLAGSLGAEVRATTASGAPALDLPVALTGSLRRSGIELVSGPGPCTACESGTLWSYRARGDVGRQALVVWLDGSEGAP
jgi:hypothetical protein